MPALPRIRLPRVTLPGRASRAAGERTTAAEPKPPNGATSAATKETKPAAKTPATVKGVDPSVQERIQGLQGWMAEIERRQGRMTYFGGVALLVAIAAAGAALYFGLTAKSDSATKGDVDTLQQRVDGLQEAVTQSSKDTQDTINNSIAQLQASIQALQKQQAQNAAAISALQSQAASGALGKRAAAGAPGAAAAPGTTTTTPNKP
jgi:uncharacterized protein HemX